ncbi:MAG: 30S ribosome-binding factor RbfA [Planctomycetota bacterium]
MANPRTIARLEAQIQRRLAHCLQFELADPRASFITLVRVELNSDLSLAKAYYSVLGSDSDRSKSEHMLEHANGFIRRQMASILRTKTVPQLKWVYDDSVASAEAMEDLIASARQRDAEIRGEGSAEAEENPGAETAESTSSED